MMTVAFPLSAGSMVIDFSFCSLLKLFFPVWLGFVLELLLTSELPRCLHEVCLFVLVVGSMSLVLTL